MQQVKGKEKKKEKKKKRKKRNGRKKKWKWKSLESNEITTRLSLWSSQKVKIHVMIMQIIINSYQF